MLKKTSIVAAVAFALVAGGYVPDAAAKLPWGKKKAQDEQPKAEEASEGEGDDGPSRTVKGKNDIEGEIFGEAAAGSPFAKLEIGMSQNQVNDLIGAGKECGTYQTGKAWIPFRYSSNDIVRNECNYTGAGRLVFTQSSNGGSYLLQIVNDANEDGYR